MTEIIIASQNHHKIQEMSAIFNHQDVRLISLKDLDDHDQVIEYGHSFIENAQIKASYFAKKYGKLTISDDSGLVIPILDGRPGIYSARYSGGDDHQNNKKILKEMEHHVKRNAYFVSVIVLCYPNGVSKSYEGRVDGLIAYEEKGKNGFGYDSIFYFPQFQKHFAELDSKIKNQISHRANALNKLKEDINEIINYK
ncbi:MAG: RdgB/HAM1 family non-canonical purine NTP pyrophosphatase [Firmicutes bacterium]|nr:RdgB/HAM1 family non-canonical purine NTP pyrophosphatase [Bacillota bacterium]